MERLVKFEVLGQEYPLYTDAPEEDVEEILRLVKSQIEGESGPSLSRFPASKIAVLTSLNMAGKYVGLKREFEQLKQAMSDQIGRLADKIDGALPREEKDISRG